MTTRRVYDTVLQSDGTPWTDGVIKFHRRPGAYAADASYPEDDISTTTDDDGYYIVTLWANGEGLEASDYAVVYPGNMLRTFVLPAGDTDISIRTLWASGGVGSWTALELQQLMEAYRAEFDAALAEAVVHGITRTIVPTLTTLTIHDNEQLLVHGAYTIVGTLTIEAGGALVIL